MLALIGSLAGFFSSFVPEIFHFLKDKKDKEHELKLINLQIEVLKTGHNSRLEEIQIKADAEESKYLYQYAASQNTNCQIGNKFKWVDALSASVRPMITYSFFLLYIYLKVSSFMDINSIAIIWTNEDQGIFCAVIGFWFGHRAFGKHRLNNNGN